MIDELRQALERTAKIVDGVSEDQYGAPTPCPDFDVRGLMNHMVAGNLLFAGAARGEPSDFSVYEQDHLDGDPGAAFRRTAENAIAGWQRPGALDENLPFGNMPGAMVIKMHLVEVLTHGWDLATATEQDPKLDPKLAGIALEAMQAVPSDMLRGSGVFGTEVEIDESAPAEERLVAFLGRDPANPCQ